MLVRMLMWIVIVMVLCGVDDNDDYHDGEYEVGDADEYAGGNGVDNGYDGNENAYDNCYDTGDD